ncbi:hypothetical protein [Pseudomonas shirazensis]|uniref:hypothetical protein n=1 Tax=Pseudomonas shirazensis TaxID=2745494 RepID=UPI003D2989CF
MSHPKNTTAPSLAQPTLTTELSFFETPIDNTALHMLKVQAGINTQDALDAARTLTSGLAQICEHVHESVNNGDLVLCDSLKALQFLSETASALIWSVQRGIKTQGGVTSHE